MNVRVTNEALLVGGTGRPLSKVYYAARLTANGTMTVETTTCYVSSIVVSVSNAGTSESLTVQNKEAPAKVIYSVPALAAGTPAPLALTDVAPVIATNGLDIVMSGTAAGTVDVFITYWK